MVRPISENAPVIVDLLWCNLLHNRIFTVVKENKIGLKVASYEGCSVRAFNIHMKEKYDNCRKDKHSQLLSY